MTKNNIKKGMDLLPQGSGKVALELALLVAEQLKNHLAESPYVKAVSLAGSIRRGKPLVSDIDVLVASRDFEAVKNLVKNYREVQQVLQEEPDFLVGEIDRGIRFEIILVQPRDYYGALVWTTGSKEFRSRVFDGLEPDRFRDANSEEEVFEKLGLSYIPPEMREN